jgi:hypothetical protein
VAQQLTLNLKDVLSAPVQADGMHTVVVQGDAADQVDLGNLLADGTHSAGQWSAEGTAVVNGQTYNVFHNSIDASVQVLIDQHMTHQVQFTG